MICFQNANILCRITGDNVLALHGVDSFQIFKITVKDQHLCQSAKSGVRALMNVSEMVPWTLIEAAERINTKNG